MRNEYKCIHSQGLSAIWCKESKPDVMGEHAEKKKKQEKKRSVRIWWRDLPHPQYVTVLLRNSSKSNRTTRKTYEGCMMEGTKYMHAYCKFFWDGQKAGMLQIYDWSEVGNNGKETTLIPVYIPYVTRRMWQILWNKLKSNPLTIYKSDHEGK